MAILSGPDWGPAQGGAPVQLVILCHGVGADGHDLIGLAPYFAQTLPGAVFVAPDAPEPFDMAPYGRQWFPIGDINPARMNEGVRKAAGVLGRFIDAELARLNVRDYALVGFSQGAMTALFTGLRHTPAPRAILAYSGALISPETLADEGRNRAPVLIAHGQVDEVVPVFRSRDAETALRAAKIEVETVYEPDLGHGISDAGLAAGAALLARAFAAPCDK